MFTHASASADDVVLPLRQTEIFLIVLEKKL